MMVRPLLPRLCPLGLESLERRDCPAVVAVIGGGTIAEGGESTVLTVRLSAPEARPVQVGYIVSGDGSTPAATAGDYRLSIGTRILAAPSGTIEFRPGETEKQVRVAAVDDSQREGTESLRFALFRPNGCTIDDAQSKADVIVRDNDDYTATIVPVGDSRIAEGAAAGFFIELSKPATKSEMFYVSTQDGTATRADYRPLRDMPVTIRAGQSRSSVFSVNTVADTDTTETDEYFLVTARPRSPDVPAVDPVGVTIIGTGPAPLTLSVTDASVKEGDSGLASCTFTVRLSAPALDPIVVQYATQDGTATAGVDYVAASGSLTFARGQISKTVTVNVIGDTVAEDTETFQIVASGMIGDTPTSAVGTGSIVNDDSNFQIDLVFIDSPLGSVPAAVRQLAREAADRWQRVIVGDLPDFPLGGGAGEFIDDFRLSVQMGLLDGIKNAAGGTIANAGPTDFRLTGTRLPYRGVAGLDPYDVSDVSSPARRQWVIDIITHELGHALGFGGSYSFQRYVQGSGWVGPRALQEYSLLSGSTQASVPLETAGGSGTAGGHWSETVFGDELMTGYVTNVGTRMPLSRLTVAAFEDLGYRVNYAAADPYRLPGSLVSPTSTASSVNIAAAVSLALQQQQVKTVARAAAFAAIG